jgi:hypothetical protein
MDSFREVERHLARVHDWFTDELAALRAERDDPDLSPVGGFGVVLENRWGSRVEVAQGRDVWFLMLLEPEPRRCISDRPKIEGTRTFWLDGWHHTELMSEMLISRDVCLTALERWLDANELLSGGGSSEQ